MTTPESEERTAPAEVERVVSAVLGSMAYMGTSGRTLIVRALPCCCRSWNVRHSFMRCTVRMLSYCRASFPHARPLRAQHRRALPSIVIATDRKVHNHLLSSFRRTLKMQSLRAHNRHCC